MTCNREIEARPRIAILADSTMSGINLLGAPRRKPVEPLIKAPQTSDFNCFSNVFFGCGTSPTWWYSSHKVRSLSCPSEISLLSSEDSCSAITTSSMIMPLATFPRGALPWTVSNCSGTMALERMASCTCAACPNSTAWLSPIANVLKQGYNCSLSKWDGV